MQTRVSMIIACYNKAQYIAKTLQSVCEQIWDHLEVILVNDGSTDDTRMIIYDWERILTKRGYSVIIINQDNAGVAGAIKKGLEYASGEYLCFPDADDEITPEYVSSMAEILDDNSSIDFVVCDLALRQEANTQISTVISTNEEPLSCKNRLEQSLLHRFTLTVCNILFRSSVFDSLGITRYMEVIPPVSQEPQILIPLFHSRTKGTVLHRPLYIYNTYARGLGLSHIKKPIEMILNKYHELTVSTINHLNETAIEKERLNNVALVGNMIHVLQIISHNDRAKYYDYFLGALHSIIPLSYNITNDTIKKGGIDFLLHAMSNNILGISIRELPIISGRVYAFGSLGQYAQNLLPYFKNTSLWPDVFWDKAATKQSSIFDGSCVSPVNAGQIEKGDTLLCFPQNKLVLDEVNKIAQERNAYAYNHDDIMDIMSSVYYPQVYENRFVSTS